MEACSCQLLWWNALKTLVKEFVLSECSWEIDGETYAFFMLFFTPPSYERLSSYPVAICHKETFYLVFHVLFSLENDMLTSTYFYIFLMSAPSER